MNNNETIFALSSGHGKSGVAVIRISGINLGQTFSKFINKKENYIHNFLSQDHEQVLSIFR